MKTALPRLHARSIVAGIRRGSSLPVLVDTASGVFVVKLRGAGHGASALIAEIVVAELAEALDLPVPERALVDLDGFVPTRDRNDELRDLLDASAGSNLAFRFLTGAADLRASEEHAIDDEFATRVLWLDALVMNPDRTSQNPNVLLWNRQPWLIDHGAALPFQYNWAAVTEDSPRVPTDHALHLFASRAPLLRRYDAPAAARLTRETLAAAIAKIPDSFLEQAYPKEDVFRLRAAYEAFLWKRLKPPRPFVAH
jgi:hypothetical protein